jgi:hypothetical protein
VLRLLTGRASRPTYAAAFWDSSPATCSSIPSRFSRSAPVSGSVASAVDKNIHHDRQRLLKIRQFKVNGGAGRLSTCGVPLLRRRMPDEGQPVVELEPSAAEGIQESFTFPLCLQQFAVSRVADRLHAGSTVDTSVHISGMPTADCQTITRSRCHVADRMRKHRSGC